MNKEKEEKLAEISARITKVIGYLGETPNSFATKLGYQRAQTVYDIQKMKSAPSYDFFQRFSIAGFSAKINIDWLLTGEGSMLRSEQHQEPTQPMPTAQTDTSSNDATVYYKMYKEEKAENKALIEEIGGLKERIRQLESRDKGTDNHSKIGEAIEAFTSELSGDYGEDSLPTKQSTISKRSSVGKT